MSRFFRPIKHLVTSSRLSPQVTSGQPIIIQRVRLRRPAAIKATLGFAIATYFCLEIYSSVVLKPLGEALQNSVPAEEEEELEPIFIPMPFTTKLVEQPAYSGRSPEWQEFVRISKDKEFQAKLRAQLAGIVRTVAENNPVLTARCGKDVKLKTWWMDIDYPLRPHPQYERTGIMMDEGVVGFVTQEVDAATVSLTEKILYPSPLARAVWAFTWTLVRSHMTGLASFVAGQDQVAGGHSQNTNSQGQGSSVPVPQPPNPSMQKALQELKRETTTRPEDIKDPATMAATKAQSPDGTTATNAANTEVDAPQQVDVPNGSTSSPSSARPNATAPLAAPNDRLIGTNAVRDFTGKSPWDAFKKTFAKSYKQKRSNPPTGCILVSGLVELETSKAYIVIDVWAYFNPKTRKYETRSMFLGLRRVQPRQQKPLRP